MNPGPTTRRSVQNFRVSNVPSLTQSKLQFPATTTSSSNTAYKSPKEEDHEVDDIKSFHFGPKKSSYCNNNSYSLSTNRLQPQSKKLPQEQQRSSPEAVDLAASDNDDNNTHNHSHSHRHSELDVPTYTEVMSGNYATDLRKLSISPILNQHQLQNQYHHKVFSNDPSSFLAADIHECVREEVGEEISDYEDHNRQMKKQGNRDEDYSDDIMNTSEEDPEDEYIPNKQLKRNSKSPKRKQLQTQSQSKRRKKIDTKQDNDKEGGEDENQTIILSDSSYTMAKADRQDDETAWSPPQSASHSTRNGISSSSSGNKQNSIETTENAPKTRSQQRSPFFLQKQHQQQQSQSLQQQNEGTLEPRHSHSNNFVDLT
jgi:hypothetical protein